MITQIYQKGYLEYKLSEGRLVKIENYRKKNFTEKLDLYAAYGNVAGVQHIIIVMYLKPVVFVISPIFTDNN
jgi:hypothetical protein